jgi:hypothetical protein
LVKQVWPPGQPLLYLIIKKNKKDMANMSYCRFENTFRDLEDCSINLNNVSSESEKRYREKLVELCKEIVEEYEFVKLNEDEDEWDDEE